MRKELKFFSRLVEANFKKEIKPYKLIFALTYRCNSRCKICNIWKKKSQNELTRDEISRILDKYNDFYWVSLTGGEIFLRKDIVEIASTIIKKCKNLAVINIPTNGLMPKWIELETRRILELNPNRLIISVSLNGTPESDVRIRGITRGFEKAVRTFELLKGINDNRLNVFFEFVISKENSDELINTINAVKKRLPYVKAEDFSIGIVNSSKHYYGKKNEKLNHTAMYEIRKFMEILPIRPNPFSIIAREYLKECNDYIMNGKVKRVCTSIKDSVFIDPFGNVYPCIIFNKKLGNLRIEEYDLESILSSKKSKDAFAKIKMRQCPGCWTPCEAYTTILSSNIHGGAWR